MYTFSFRKEETRLDILINNASIISSERKLTVDGHEMQFGVNYLGHFLLTNLLLDMLKANAPSRIITVSSIVHYWGRISKTDIMSTRHYSKWGAYSQSKLANVLFTRCLSKLLQGSGVTANCLHPGIVQPDTHGWPVFYRLLLYPFFWFLKTTKSGAQTAITLALEQKLLYVSGQYFSECKPKKESKTSQDDTLADWLWNTSEQFTGLVKFSNSKSNGILI